MSDRTSDGSVDVDDEPVRCAGDLAAPRRLRVTDAIHPAAASWVRDAGTTLVSFDQRLGEAAAADGLAVLPEAV